MQAQATEHQFHFPTDWKSIYDRIQAIDPIKYASTRNFENGALTLLGPYISRGVISTKFVFEHVNSLDLEWKATEKLVQSAITKMQKGRTTIIIAHRLSTIQNADRIIVLKEGEIIEQGSHEELIKASGEYANLNQQQL